MLATNLFAEATNLFAVLASLFVELANLFAEATNLFAEATNLFAELTNLFTESTNLFAELANLFVELANLFAEFTNFRTSLTSDVLMFACSHVRMLACSYVLRICSHVLNSCSQALKTDSPRRMFAHRNGNNVPARVPPAAVRGPPRRAAPRSKYVSTRFGISIWDYWMMRVSAFCHNNLLWLKIYQTRNTGNRAGQGSAVQLCGSDPYPSTKALVPLGEEEH